MELTESTRSTWSPLPTRIPDTDACLAGGPAHYSPRRGIFMLSRHADVRAAARADDVMSSAEGVTMGRVELPVLLTSDRPAHTRMRKQVQPAFTRAALESWRPMVDHLGKT